MRRLLSYDATRATRASRVQDSQMIIFAQSDESQAGKAPKSGLYTVLIGRQALVDARQSNFSGISTSINRPPVGRH